jgi:hypothetical protein
MRQLSLFKTNRQRGTEPPPPTEFALQCVLADFVDRWLMPDWRATHIPLGERRDFRIDARGRRYSPSGTRLKRAGTKAGWPDWVFVGLDRRVLWLELKRKKTGQLSDAQIDIGEHLQRCGFPYLVTSDIRTAVEWLKRHGVLRATIEV